jgi:hypothetical protein
VIYNWGFNSAYGGEEGQHNLRYNYYKAGPATKKEVRNRIVEPWDSTGFWYVEGNYVDGFPDITADNWNGGVHAKGDKFQVKRSATLFDTAPVTVQTPNEAFASILQNVGACVPERDTVDARVIYETKTGTAQYGKLWGGGGKGIIDSQNDVGGWPELHSLPAPVDSDHDGMPDAWETALGLNPNDSKDGNKKSDDGYTMLELYLNSLVSSVVGK